MVIVLGTFNFNSVLLAHSEQAVIAHACHGHTPVINWAVCLGQQVSS